jgi:hypothetical protein
LRQVGILVVHSAPLSELESGEQDTRLNLAEILAGWKSEVEILLLAGPPSDAVVSVEAEAPLEPPDSLPGCITVGKSDLALFSLSTQERRLPAPP